MVDYKPKKGEYVQWEEGTGDGEEEVCVGCDDNRNVEGERNQHLVL